MPCSIAFIVASPTAVLRRSSRPSASPSPATASRHALDREALVALGARHVELGQQRRPAGAVAHVGGAGRALEHDHGDVVLLLGVRPGVGVEVGEDAVDQLGAAGVVGDALLEAREAEHLAVGVVRLDDAVGVQEQGVAGLEHGLLLLVGHAGHEAERHAAGAQLVRAVGGLDVGQVVAGVGEAEVAGLGVEHAVQAGDEHLLRHVRAEVLVDALEHLPGVDQPLGRGAQHAAGGGHDERGRHALVGDVADDEADPALGQRDDVVEVAADLARGPVVGRHLPARELGELLGEEVLLDQLGDLELLLEALARGRLGLLLAHELADPQRRRGLGGEVVEQLAVVGGVLLLGEPRAEVEDADQLALADERDRELDPGGLELGQRGRVELERLDVDRPARALQVGEQRVVGRDVDRRGLLPRRGRRRRGRRLLVGSATEAAAEGAGQAGHVRVLSTGHPSGNRYGPRAGP